MIHINRNTTCTVSGITHAHDYWENNEGKETHFFTSQIWSSFGNSISKLLTRNILISLSIDGVNYPCLKIDLFQSCERWLVWMKLDGGWGIGHQLGDSKVGENVKTFLIFFSNWCLREICEFVRKKIGCRRNLRSLIEISSVCGRDWFSLKICVGLLKVIALLLIHAGKLLGNINTGLVTQVETRLLNWQ